jgi:hypothetical protein
VRHLYAADETLRRRIVSRARRRRRSLRGATLPQLPAAFDSRTLWTRGLLLSYAAELRSERPEKIATHYTGAATELDARARALSVDQRWEHAAADRWRNPTASAARSRSTLSDGRCRPRAGESC